MFIKFIHQAKTYSRLSDEELVKKIVQQDDKKSIEELFNRYVHLLYGVCLKYLKDSDNAKDAVMEIFQNALEKLQAAEIRSFKAWIYTVTKNHCLMHLRKNSSLNNFKHNLTDFFLSEIMESGTDLNLIHKESDNEKEDNLELALTKLKKEQEQCVRLMYLENKTYKEIAGITGYTLNEVKSHIQNGKRNLKILITSNNGKNNQHETF